MPRHWYDYHANALPEDATDEQTAEREFNLSILADRKPYFMRYIYPTLMKEYRAYMKSVETKCVREFRLSLDELLGVPEDERTDEQRQFIGYYERRLPVSTHNCVMNRICRRFEAEFDGKMKIWCEEPFDYSIMKSGAEYTPRQFAQIRKIYDDHNEWMQGIARRGKLERIYSGEQADAKLWQSWFKNQCFSICNNGFTVGDIILDMCYRRSGSKEFVWDMCGQYIIANLAKRHDGIIQYPARDPDGDIEYAGMTFSMRSVPLVWGDEEEEFIERNYPEREGMGEGSD